MDPSVGAQAAIFMWQRYQRKAAHKGSSWGQGGRYTLTALGASPTAQDTQKAH